MHGHHWYRLPLSNNGFPVKMKPTWNKYPWIWNTRHDVLLVQCHYYVFFLQIGHCLSHLFSHWNVHHIKSCCWPQAWWTLVLVCCVPCSLSELMLSGCKWEWIRSPSISSQPWNNGFGQQGLNMWYFVDLSICNCYHSWFDSYHTSLINSLSLNGNTVEYTLHICACHIRAFHGQSYQ